MDGGDNMIMYGTGTTIGHSAMAMRFDGELYVIESYGGSFRPDDGIFRTPWAQWMTEMRASDCFVSWMPLSADFKAKFDEQKAQDFFHAHEGSQYGISNFLFGWIDTPYSNWPPLIPRYLLPILMSFIETVRPEFTDKLFGEGLNKRLGTTGKSISQLAGIAAEQGLNLQEVMAMVEEDGWIYNGLNPASEAFVCSAFVTGVYKAAGIFGDLVINATEFTPGNVVEMKIFDTETPRPQACIDADPNLKMCQLNGTHRQYMPHYNTIDLYAHMNENCAINWPHYTKDPGC